MKSNDNVISMSWSSQTFLDELTALLHGKAQDLIRVAVETELQVLLDRYAELRTEDGRRLVVRRGFHPTREIQTQLGPIEVKIPKVRSNTVGNPVTFRSSLIPPYVRKTGTLEAFVPQLYLSGISSGDMSEVLGTLVGQEQMQGFSSAVLSRLKQQWKQEYRAWRERDLSDQRFVYMWADGIYSKSRGDRHSGKLCTLVLIAVDEYGKKHLLAVEDGVRESTISWRAVLLKLKACGLTEAPKVAVGDGAMGFGAALSELYPETRHQRCWVHKTANVLNCFPKSLPPQAKTNLHEIWMADTRKNAETAWVRFDQIYGA